MRIDMDTRAVVGPLLALVLSACGQSPEAPAPAPAPAPAAEPSPAAPAVVPAAHEGHAHAAAALELPALPPGAAVSFMAPADGARIEGAIADGKIAVAVKMGASGIAIKPAGPVEVGSGHHHILVDAADVAAGAIVPKDEQHVHFGKGEQEATLQLAPGEHVLTLQLADGIHRSYGQQVASKIKVTVVPAAAPAPATKP
jgi:hypothetical protein